jgi:tetratricopeptide (TPR) repeat protein
VYTKALQASGGDPMVQEKLEDVQIFLREQSIGIARAKYKEDKTPENEELYKKLKQELNKFEMDVYRRRTERNPTVKGLWAEFGLRLQNEKLFKEAIRAYQKARGDESRKGMVLFGLGYCFQAEKQYQLAMSHYKEAETVVPDSEADTKKEVLYAIGRLAMGLKDLDTARDYLSRLASMDYAYKDVAERLDKLTQG